MIARMVTLSALLFASHAMGADPKVLRDIDDGRVKDRWIVVGVDGSQYDAMRRIAAEYAAEEMSKRSIFRLIMADSEMTLFRSVASLTSTGASSPADRSRDATPQQFRGTTGRVFGSTDGVLFSYRSGSQFREEMLMGRRDPTLISDQKWTYRILHLSLSQLGPAASKQPDYALRIFLRTSCSISATSVGRLVGRFSGSTNASQVNVAARRDEWFLGDPEYPSLLPFLRSWDWVARQQAASRPVLVCGNGSKRITCSGQVFSP